VTFSQKNAGGAPFFVFNELEEIPDFVHAVTSRLTDAAGASAVPGGRSLSGKALLFHQLGLPSDRIIQLRQTHSDRIVVADDGVAPVLHDRAEADGIILRHTGWYGVVRTADCLPLLAVLPGGRQACLVHAGWRGTRDRIAAKGVVQLLGLTGASPSEIVVGIGPCIRSCCYEVGAEVRAQFEQLGHDTGKIFQGPRLDLAAANAAQLRALGVTRIIDSGLCTACRTDLFYSYRRDGATGRLWTLAGFAR
jgi:YfiH family protein